MPAVLTQLVYLKYRAGEVAVALTPWITHRARVNVRTTHRARGDIRTTHRARLNARTTHRVMVDA